MSIDVMMTIAVPVLLGVWIIVAGLVQTAILDKEFKEAASHEESEANK